MPNPQKNIRACFASYCPHLILKNYSWDSVQKNNNTHPIVYVAKGSHGGYPTTDMKHWDVFELGGREISSNDFNWYYTTVEKGCFIDKIIKHIENSLKDKDGSLWTNDWRLTQDIRNIKAFNEERNAIKRMLISIDDKRFFNQTGLSSEAKEIFTEVIDNLIQSDKLLAQTIIEDAKVVEIKNPQFETKVNRFISKAEDEYRKGVEELDKLEHKYYQERAIDRFSKSWLFGLEAMKIASGEI